MKKLTLSVFALMIMALSACGPSEEEKAAAEKARLDSIANVQAEMERKAAEDSAMAAQAAAQQAMQDSINAATQQALQDSIDMLKGSVKKMQKKSADEKKKEEKKQKDMEQLQKGKG